MNLQYIITSAIIFTLFLKRCLCVENTITIIEHFSEDDSDHLSDLTFFKDIIKDCSRFQKFDSLDGAVYSECQREVLQPFLKLCVKKGMESISSDTRIITSIQMAICDYKAAKTDFPIACSPAKGFQAHELESGFDINTCLSELIKTPSLYNAYHSYQLSLGSICKQESIPFEKDQIIHMYSDLTHVIAELTNDVGLLASSTEAYIASSKNKMKQAHDKMLADIVEDINEVRMREMAKVTLLMDNFVNSFTQKFMNLSTIFESQREYVETKTSSLFDGIMKNLSDVQDMANLSDSKIAFDGLVVNYQLSMQSMFNQTQQKAYENLKLPNEKILRLGVAIEEQMNNNLLIISQQEAIITEQLEIFEFEKAMIGQIVNKLDMSLNESMELYIEQVDVITKSFKDSGLNFGSSFRSLLERLISYFFISSSLLLIALASFSIGYLNYKANYITRRRGAGSVDCRSLLKKLIVSSLGAFAIISGGTLSKHIFDVVRISIF